jgi:recombination protein RecT
MSSTVEKAKEQIKSNGQLTKSAVSVPVTMKGLKSSQVKGVFELYREQIAQAIPKHLTAERIIQLATTLITRSPELAECSTESLLGSVMQASILGFEPVAALGQCYFVPFNNKKSGKREIQFIIGYRGMIDLARNSNQLKDIYAQCVYSNDVFDYEFGLEPKLKHKPALEDRGDLTHVYAVAHFTNGGYAFEVMSKFDVDKIKKVSQAGSSQYSPWNSGFYDEMAKKTVIRRLWKLLPSSVDKKNAVVSDEKPIDSTMFKNGELDTNELPATFETVDETTGEIKEELFENAEVK